MPEILILTVLSYLAGSLPTSYLAGRLIGGIDLREHGSGNLGATNAFRLIGPAPGIAVLLVDIFKGFAPVFWLPALAGLESAAPVQVGMALAAVAGHIFSPFVGFRGGKGVATGTGVVLAIMPRVLLICMLVWAVVFALSRIVSISSLVAALALPLTVFLTVDHALDGFMVLEVFAVVITVVVFITHRSNIRRLLRGEEKRLFSGRGGPQ